MMAFSMHVFLIVQDSEHGCPLLATQRIVTDTAITSDAITRKPIKIDQGTGQKGKESSIQILTCAVYIYVAVTVKKYSKLSCVIGKILCFMC